MKSKNIQPLHTCTVSLLRTLCFCVLTFITFLSTTAQANTEKAPYKGLLVSSQALYLLAKAATKNIESPKKMFEGKDIGHHNSIRPSTVIKIRGASFIVWLGPEIEAPLARIIDGKKHAWAVMRVAALNPYTLRSLNPTDKKVSTLKDPHIWLDPMRAQAIVHGIAAARAKTYPAFAAQYKRNAVNFSRQVRHFVNNTHRKSYPIPYFAYHDAYQYGEKIFGLNYQGAFTKEPEDPIRPRQFMYLKERMTSLQTQNKKVCFLVNDSLGLSRVPLAFRQNAVIVDEKLNDYDNYIAAMQSLQKRINTCYR